MRAHIRDVVVVAVLLVTGVAAVLAWQPLGRWTALVIALAGVLLAAGAYRARPLALPLFGTGRPMLSDEPREEPDETASTPRPS
jgi:hypothetical protein